MKVIVVGAGAAGLMAAFSAARAGAVVTVIEKNERPGVKLALTGNGRCNLTHVGEARELIGKIPGNGRFLYSALHRFGPEELHTVLAQLGVPTKVEGDGRVFPVSDRATDVINGFERALQEMGVCWRKERAVQHLCISAGTVSGVVLTNGETLAADAVIVCTGGASYPKTGSTGDGYRLAREAGHQVVSPVPSLVPLESDEEWVKQLQGLALRGVRVRGLQRGRLLCAETGDLLFTHFGLSGPVILLLSKMIAPVLLEEAGSVSLSIDLTPKAGDDELAAEIQQVFNQHIRKTLKNALENLLPGGLVPVVLQMAGISAQKPVHQVTREERRRLVKTIKDLLVALSRPRPLAEAIVTAGGVSVKELNPQTMESKLVKRLYFAGEVVDVDGLTGGYNLQAAFAMGFLAGAAAAAGHKTAAGSG